MSVLALLAVALVSLAGCGQDNEQAANITGVDNPEATSSSDYEAYSSKMSKQGTGSQEGYPGQ